MRSRFRTVLAVAACLLLGVTVAGSCGSCHWILDLTSHFRAYWLVASVVSLVLSLGSPRSIAFACSALAVIGNAWAMLPLCVPVMPGPPAAVAAEPANQTANEPAPPLTLVVANLHRVNPDRSRAIAYLRDRKPDVAVLIEVDAAWLADLAALHDVYPHRISEPRSDNFGIAVWSRWPLVDARVVGFGSAGLPSITATARFHGRDVALVATHPHPPFDAAHAAVLLDHLTDVAAAAAATPRPCVVAGDFNATPWSLAYRAFAARSGMRDTALGHGVRPTWNARLPGPRIPIDHVFASPDIVVAERAVGPDIGSDHFPVEVALTLPPAG